MNRRVKIRKPALERGTFVPAVLAGTRPALTAQAHREAARVLLREADKLDGKRSRVTFLDLPAGYCSDCGNYAQGDHCPTCGTPAHQGGRE